MNTVIGVASNPVSVTLDRRHVSVSLAVASTEITKFSDQIKA